MAINNKMLEVRTTSKNEYMFLLKLCKDNNIGLNMEENGMVEKLFLFRKEEMKSLFKALLMVDDPYNLLEDIIGNLQS